MGKLTAREAAMLRMAMDDETRPLQKDRANMDTNIGAAYPRMLYRMTDIEDVHVDTTKDDGTPREVTIRNKFDGLLCEMCVVESADEAEALASDGWEISPRAAHGMADGLAVAVTAKDDEIARLRAELAQRDEMAGVKPADNSQRATLKPKADAA